MWKSDLNIAIEAAHKAGEYLRSISERTVVSEEGKDIKATADSESEELIKGMIKKHSNYPILGEESHEEFEMGDDQLFWVVDPIDGTLNYIRRIDICCVSIALWKGRTPIVGVVYDFIKDELFHTIVGEGVFLNNSELEVPKSRPIGNAILGTGFPSYLKHDKDTLERYLDNIQRYKKIRLFGSAALSITYVSAGRIDAYYEKQIKLWDVAAGLAFIESMGIYYTLNFLDEYSVELDIQNCTA